MSRVTKAAKAGAAAGTKSGIAERIKEFLVDPVPKPIPLSQIDPTRFTDVRIVYQ